MHLRPDYEGKSNQANKDDERSSIMMETWWFPGGLVGKPKQVSKPASQSCPKRRLFVIAHDEEMEGHSQQCSPKQKAQFRTH